MQYIKLLKIDLINFLKILQDFLGENFFPKYKNLFTSLKIIYNKY